MRALVTGVAGFIGAHVAEALLQRGWEVTGIDDLSGGRTENLPTGVDFIQRDCCEPMDALFQDCRPEAVIHLAAYAAEGLSHHIPNFNYHNNLVATSNILSSSLKSGARHFVFTSSIAAYGHPSTTEPFDETTRCHPCDPYGVAKYSC